MSIISRDKGERGGREGAKSNFSRKILHVHVLYNTHLDLGESEGMHTHTCDTPTHHTHTHTHTHLKHQGEAPDSDAQVLDTLQSLLLPHKFQVVLERKPHSVPVALPLRHPHDVLVQIKQRDLRGLVKIVRRLEQVLDGGVLDNGAHAQLLII